MRRTRPIWSRTGALTAAPIAVALPPDWSELKIEVDARALVQLGDASTPPAVSAVSGVTTIQSLGGPTGGTFALRVLDRGQVLATTAALTYDESAADIKTALVNTGQFASGDITAAGGALPTDVTLTWGGVYAGAAPELEAVSALTGGSNPRIRVAVTTLPKGNGGYAYLAGNTQEVWESDGRGSAGERFLYLATVSGSGTFYVSAYR